MDLTAVTAELAAAASDVARLLPTRTLDPVLAGLLLTATAEGLVLAGTDRERAVRLHCPARVHEDGAVLVPARPLAETLRALDEPDVRLVVEGNRLAVRTPHSRFGLPLLDVDLHPGVAEPPAVAGRADGRPLLRALAAVAGAASKDDALPLFTGVRLRAEGDTLRLVATDRYRLAIAELPWRPEPAAAPLDVLVPATLVTELARQAAGADRLTLHADTDRFALAWGDSVIGTALLAAPFPNEDRYLHTRGDASVEVATDALAAAVRRVALYADGRGAIGLELGDGEVRVRGGSPELGDADESVKATVVGRLSQTYRVRYLQDALRVFGDRPIRVWLREGLKTTVFTEAEPDPDGVALRYLVMPILPAGR
ncbi:MAG TPA: DNA polymerase III subunit beta [Pseudonocardiaceae bacterium]|jgi:DNA polymerase-3 subunit beta|nr:DNA polymerase III subunit beta [Pseudonocardiaceae bacterium]